MSLSALGILSAAGSGGLSTTGTFELITTTLISSSTASVDFTGLSAYSATYKHLQIRAVTKNSSTGSTVLRVTFNGVATGYGKHFLGGSPSSGVISSGQANQTHIAIDQGMAVSTTANAFGASVIDILDIYSTTKNKTLRAFNGTADNSSLVAVGLNSGFLNSTTAISSIQLFAASNNIAAGSRLSIYGIRG
jgi:hypothetical protein